MFYQAFKYFCAPISSLNLRNVVKMLNLMRFLNFFENFEKIFNINHVIYLAQVCLKLSSWIVPHPQVYFSCHSAKCNFLLFGSPWWHIFRENQKILFECHTPNVCWWRIVITSFKCILLHFKENRLACSLLLLEYV